MKIYPVMKILIILGIILSLSTPVFADNIGIYFANSTMNFGTVAADGSTYSISSTATISGNTNVDLYVRDSGDLTDTAGDIIPNNPNFQLRIQYLPRSINSGYVTLSNVNQILWRNWPKPNTGGGDIATETYLLTVPSATPIGTYQTTITFTVVTAGITPTSASTVQMNGVTTYSINNTTNTSSNDTTNFNTT